MLKFILKQLILRQLLKYHQRLRLVLGADHYKLSTTSEVKSVFLAASKTFQSQISFHAVELNPVAKRMKQFPYP